MTGPVVPTITTNWKEEEEEGEEDEGRWRRRPGVDPWQEPNNPWPTPVTSQQVFGQSDRTSANGVTFGMSPGLLMGRAHRWQGPPVSIMVQLMRCRACFSSQRTGWFQELVGEGGGRGGTLFLSKI